jgi:D-alanyl-lipoteichoic acid acyltransferase DltB (MBOAT superfamily)
MGLSNARWYTMLQMALTFHVVCLGWVLFRAKSIWDSLFLVGNLATMSGVAAKGWLLLGFSSIRNGRARGRWAQLPV